MDEFLGWLKILKYIRFFFTDAIEIYGDEKKSCLKIALKFHIQLPKHFVLIETKQRVHKTKESVVWPHMNFMFILTSNLCLCGHWFIRFQNVNKGIWKHTFFFRKGYAWKNLAHCYRVLDTHIFALNYCMFNERFIPVFCSSKFAWHQTIDCRIERWF